MTAPTPADFHDPAQPHPLKAGQIFFAWASSATAAVDPAPNLQST